MSSATASGLDDDVARCVAEALRDIRFPPSSSAVNAKFPFRFVPSGELQLR